MKQTPSAMKTHCKQLATVLAALLAIPLLAAPRPLVWRADFPSAKVENFPVRHGTDVEFRPSWHVNGVPANTNGEWTLSLSVQTNGAPAGEWATIPGTVFSHTNDCGADAYNVLVRAVDADGTVDYSAAARLRMLPSPGFEPGALPPAATFQESDPVFATWLSAFHESDPVFSSWLSTFEIPETSLEPATNYTARSISSFAATGTVARASSYGTPTRWTDATGCVWEAGEKYPSSITLAGVGEYQYIGSAGGVHQWGPDSVHNYISFEEGDDRWTYYNDQSGVWIASHAIVNGEQTVTLQSAFSGSEMQISYVSHVGEINLVGRVALTNDLMTAENDPTVPDWAKEPSPPSYSAADVGAATHRDATNAAEAVVAPVATSVGVVWSLVYGGTAWFAVTNYLRTADGVVPSMQFWEVRDGVTNLVYSSAEEIDAKVEALRLVVQGMLGVLGTSLSNRVAGLEAAMPSKAWSRYQSATGAEAPDGVTVISTPTTMLSANYEWQRYVDVSSNSVWLLQARGVTVLGADSNQFFRVSDDDGNVQFEVSKTASQLVPAYIAKTGFSAGNFEVTCPVNVQPKLFTAYSLAGPWSAEGDDANISVTWASVDGAWKGTVLQSSVADQLFVKAKYWQEGETKVVNRAPVEASGGIYCTDGIHKTRPVYVPGGSVSWEVLP